MLQSLVELLYGIASLHSIHRGRLGVDVCDIMLLYSAATYVIVWLRTAENPGL